MSQHSPVSTTATMSTTTTSTSTTTTTTTTKESSTKPGSSATGSLKKQKNKDAEVPLTDDFVLMTTPDKFKDKNINETNVVKRHRTDSSPNDQINLECLLLSDTSEQCGAPQHVKTILQHCDSTQLLSQAEILFVLVYIVALESGFIGHSDYEQTKLYVDHLSATSSFHAKNILRLSRLKTSYEATANRTRFTLKLRTLMQVEPERNDYVYALLTGFVTGDFLIAALTPAHSTGAKGFSTTLSIGRYVLAIHGKDKALHQRFSKLDELACILRDQLFVPMRCQHLCWLDCCVYPSLDGMPAELYDLILKYLNRNQLKILANVNKSMHNLIKSSKFMPQSNTSSTRDIV